MTTQSNAATLELAEKLYAASGLTEILPFNSLTTLTVTIKVLAFSSAHMIYLREGIIPDNTLVQSFVAEDPEVMKAVVKATGDFVAFKRTHVEAPAHEVFAETLQTPLLGLFAVSRQCRTEDSVTEMLQIPEIESLLNKAMTVLWVILYPNASLPGGESFPDLEALGNRL